MVVWPFSSFGDEELYKDFWYYRLCSFISLSTRDENTVASRYLEVEGTLWNTSRYPYFDILDVPNWGKYKSNKQISQMNM